MKVSALMVTQPGREHLAQLAVKDFNDQTYANRELITVLDEGSLTLGQLRNIAVETAQGDLCITWDDDDRYGKHRIEAMVAGLGNADMCFLNRLTLKCRCGAVVISQPRAWECSVIFRKASSAPYPPVDMAEDAAMLATMVRLGAKVATIDDPSLYQKLWHDSNVTGDATRGLLKRAGHLC